MKKTVHILIGIYLTVVVLFTSINPLCVKGSVVTGVIEEEIVAKEVSMDRVSDDESYWDRYSSYYYYNQLSEEEKTLWDDLEAVCKYYLENDVDIEEPVYTFEWDATGYTKLETAEHTAAFKQRFEYAHPHYGFFRIDTDVEYYEGSNIVKVNYYFRDELIEGSQRMRIVNETKEQLENWNEIVDSCDTDYEKILKIAQLLAGEKKYEIKNVYNQSLYNTVCNEGIVCQGYALAFNMLSNYAGIESLCVACDDEDEPHVWNMVKLNGVWYHVDVTWMDECEEWIEYNWFLRADEFVSEQSSHTAGKYFWPYVPKCEVDSERENMNFVGECPEPVLEQVASPKIVVNSVDETCMVEISGNENSVIYYTTDGSLPSPYEKCAIYKEPFEVASNVVIKAMAVKAGCIDSEIASTDTSNSYMIAFDANGGEIATKEKQVSVGNVYGFLPRPTKEGYIFTGWHTALDSGEKIESSDIVKMAEEHILYAGWKKKECKGHIYNGTDQGIDWSIDDKGELTIVGTGEIYQEGEWHRYNDKVVSAEVSLTESTSLSRLFYDFSKLKDVKFVNMDTSQVVDVSEMFSLCVALESLDLSGFDMSKVENAKEMLYKTEAIATIQAPLNVAIDIETPSDQFVDSQGNYISLLPKNTNVSEELVNAVDVRFMNSQFIVGDLEISRISIKRLDEKSEVSVKAKTITECESRRIALNFFLMNEEGEIVDKVPLLISTLGVGDTIDNSVGVNRIIKEGVICDIRAADELYAVILDNQGATEEGTLSVDVSYESDMPDITIPKKTGYIFKGYYNEEGGKGDKYYDSTGVGMRKYPYIEGVTLYAYWEAEGADVYGEPQYEWSEDGKQCSVVFTSINDETHQVTEEATVTSIIKTEATCKDKGITTYTARCSFEGEIYTDSKDVEDIEIDLDSHVWDVGVVTKDPSTTQKGEKTYTCNVCKSTKIEEIPMKSDSDSKEQNTEEPKQPLQVGETYASDDGTATYEVTTSDATNGTVIYVAPSDKNETEVTIPDAVVINGITYSVTAIEKNAFKNNKNIKSVTIGKNVKMIGANAFSNCTKIKTVKMGSEVTTIADKAFYKCTALSKISVPSKVKMIGKNAFYGCKKLTSATIGKNVSKIGTKAFYGCSKLKTLTIKSTKLTAKKVGNKAFSKLPKNVKIILPKKKFETYKSMLIRKGINKKAKFKKN